MLQEYVQAEDGNLYPKEGTVSNYGMNNPTKEPQEETYQTLSSILKEADKEFDEKFGTNQAFIIKQGLISSNEPQMELSDVKDFLHSQIKIAYKAGEEKGEKSVCVWMKKTGKEWKQEPVMAAVNEIRQLAITNERERIINKFKKYGEELSTRSETWKYRNINVEEAIKLIQELNNK